MAAEERRCRLAAQLSPTLQTGEFTQADGSPKRCHPHMFRDTFAVEMLLAGVPIDQVSLLLDTLREDHREKLLSFCEGKQIQLQDSVRNAWQVGANPCWIREQSVEYCEFRSQESWLAAHTLGRRRKPMKNGLLQAGTGVLLPLTRNPA